MIGTALGRSRGLCRPLRPSAPPPLTPAAPRLPRCTDTPNVWKETGHGKPATDVTRAELAPARPQLKKATLSSDTAGNMFLEPTAEFRRLNVWHNNKNMTLQKTSLLSTVPTGAAMDFRRKKSDVTRC